MTKIITWIVSHPDVKVRFNYDETLNAIVIRVQKYRYISQYAIDKFEYYPIPIEKTDDYIIEVLNDLYNKIEKEEKEYDSQ